jgi:calcium-dependent protein kinase
MRKIDRKWTEAQVSRIIYQVMMAITYLHANGIVHRDIKPENILFYNKSNFDVVKIIDFGSATLCKRDISLKEQFGSPYYIAPEVIEQSYG